MITIVHGNDTAKSRQFYIEEKQKSKNPLVLSGKGLTYDTFFQNLEGNQLFSDSVDMFVENFFSEVKSNSNEFKNIVEYLVKKDTDILFWEEKELTKSQANSFKKSRQMLFNFPQVLFTFLDNISPRNSKSIELLRELKQNMEVELIFFMLIRQFRFLLAFSEGSSNSIDEVKRLAPWQISKFKRQLSLFTKEKVVENYKKLYEMDYKSKFGLLPYPLGSAIDIFLLDL